MLNGFSQQRVGNREAGFTLAELLVVIAILVVLAATQLPALTRAKAPVQQTVCLNNLRKIGSATTLYVNDNNDTYPYGNRCFGFGIGVPPPPNSVLDPSTWPQQLLPYFGLKESTSSSISTNQPLVYLCPSEKGTAPNWAFQLHFMANRSVFTDVNDTPVPIRVVAIKKPSLYLMVMGKGPGDFGNIRPGAMANPVLAAWNYPPGSPQFRRHDGRCNASAVDGHVESLFLAPYKPGSPPPPYFLDLGDTSDMAGSTWPDSGRVKLYFRAHHGAGGDAF